MYKSDEVRTTPNLQSAINHSISSGLLAAISDLDIHRNQVSSEYKPLIFRTEIDSPWLSGSVFRLDSQIP